MGVVIISMGEGGWEREGEEGTLYAQLNLLIGLHSNSRRVWIVPGSLSAARTVLEVRTASTAWTNWHGGPPVQVSWAVSPRRPRSRECPLSRECSSWVQV